MVLLIFDTMLSSLVFVKSLFTTQYVNVQFTTYSTLNKITIVLCPKYRRDRQLQTKIELF